MRTLLILTALLAAGCGGGGSGSSPPVSPPPPPVLSLDGIYRGSPVVVSSGGFSYDTEKQCPNCGDFQGAVGRVYTTTVTGNAISGTASIFRPEAQGGNVTAALNGTVDAQGNVTINFVDGAVNVSVNVARLAGPPINIMGRAWCSYDESIANPRFLGCAEFDVLSRLFIQSGPPDIGGIPRKFIDIELGPEQSTNVYDVTVTTVNNGIRNAPSSGLASFAISEDGLSDELSISVVNGDTYQWWIILTTIP